MKIRYYVEATTGLPHIHEHGVSEDEVRRILAATAYDMSAKAKWALRRRLRRKQR